jgi:uridine kinase
LHKKYTMKPFIIGITGGSGSGKTSLIKEIRTRFSTEEVCIVLQDDYYFPRDLMPIDENNEKNFDLPKCIDKKSLHNDICRLLVGETVEKEEYTFNNAALKPKMLIYKPAPIIIVEGLFVFHFKKIAPLFNLKIFVYAQENLKVIRRIKRDQIERGYPIDDVLYKYEHHVMPSYEKYILPYKDDADIVINNNDDMKGGVDFVVGFIQSRLK